MSIFSKKESKDEYNDKIAIEDFAELKKIEAQDIIEDFEEKTGAYPLLSDSNIYYDAYYKLKNLEFEVKKNSDDMASMETLLVEMKEISSEFIKKCLANDMKMKENAEAMRNFAKKNKRFFVIEPLFETEDNINDVIYCFSYNVRYDIKKDKMLFLALTNRSQNAEYMSISPADSKVREMNAFDFGEYVDIRFANFKTISEEHFLCDKYKKLYDMFIRDKEKSKN